MWEVLENGGAADTYLIGLPFDRRVSPLCPLLLRSQALLTASCLLF